LGEIYGEEEEVAYQVGGLKCPLRMAPARVGEEPGRGAGARSRGEEPGRDIFFTQPTED